MQWFPVEKSARNDWRIKSVLRTFKVQGVGHLFLLWSYIASEGSQDVEGLGVQRDGTPLPLQGMAEDCAFDSVEALTGFLDHLAQIGHIEAERWKTGIVFLPAMNRRLTAYRQSKGRGGEVGAPRPKRGRPAKKTGNVGESREKVGNAGESREKLGKAGQSPVLDLLPSDQKAVTDTEPDPILKGPQDLMTLWNEIRSPGPKVTELTKQRRVQYRNAIQAKPQRAEWSLAIRFLNGQPWANAPGEGQYPNWRADLDWLAKSGKLVKVLERAAAVALPTAKTGTTAGRVAVTPGKYDHLERDDDGQA